MPPVGHQQTGYGRIFRWCADDLIGWMRGIICASMVSRLEGREGPKMGLKWASQPTMPRRVTVHLPCRSGRDRGCLKAVFYAIYLIRCGITTLQGHVGDARGWSEVFLSEEKKRSEQ